MTIFSGIFFRIIASFEEIIFLPSNFIPGNVEDRPPIAKMIFSASTIFLLVPFVTSMDLVEVSLPSPSICVILFFFIRNAIPFDN